ENEGLGFADWENRLLFLPEVMAEFPPDNPSVAMHWIRALNELPDCSVKQLIIEKAIATSRGWIDPALIHGVTHGVPHPVPHQLTVNSEQLADSSEQKTENAEHATHARQPAVDLPADLKNFCSKLLNHEDGKQWLFPFRGSDGLLYAQHGS